MGNRVSFSSEVLRIEGVARMHDDTAKSLRFYYTAPCLAQRDPKFVGYSIEDVRQELDERLCELDRSAALGVLSALEASFRTDFLWRCYERRKDDLSRRFRELHKLKENRAALEDDILEAWKQHVPTEKALISEIIGAFKYRHWLAHGRYWIPKLGKRRDFFSVYLLARDMERVFAAQSA
jgi:hypothetical protein